MIFNSLEFAIFLPIAFLLYWFVFGRNVRLQNAYIIAISYFFYGCWDYRFLFLIAFTSLCSYASGIFIDNNKSNKRCARTISIINIVINLGILGLFKYYNFFVESFANLFGLPEVANNLTLNLILPVGISFYTFQALSYSIDVYNGRIKPTKDIVQFFAYVSFFPQLVAGPIERATNLLPQFEKPRFFDYSMAVDGLRQMLWGFFKKIVIADNCALFVDEIFNNYASSSGSTLFLSAILFSFQIYCDFSGYSDIAIGTAKLFGIKLMKNFNFPYLSRNIAEFWSRWHISLTTWFRDYLYIPLGGNRRSLGRTVFNTFVIFLVSGFWHGANWTFIIWGLYHALLFVPLLLTGNSKRYKNQTVAQDKVLPSISEVFHMLLTFVLVVVGWIIFRSESMSQFVGYMRSMCQLSLFSVPEIKGLGGVFLSLFILVVAEWLQRRKNHVLEFSGSTPIVVRYLIYVVLILFIFIFGGHAENFIYFQF